MEFEYVEVECKKWPKLSKKITEEKSDREDGEFYGDECLDDDDEDDESPVDWHNECGDFTKKYNEAVKTGGRYRPNSLNKPKVDADSYSISVEKYEGPAGLPRRAANSLIEHEKTQENYRYRVRNKSDRATVEQVLDAGTCRILYKFLSRDVISTINGCISTGKEANFYHANSSAGDRAIKICKTSILTFKDRDRYVTGKFRFNFFDNFCKFVRERHGIFAGDCA